MGDKARREWVFPLPSYFAVISDCAGDHIGVEDEEIVSEKPKAVTIHVTGFKKFQGFANNPTETIANNLMSFVQNKGLLPAGVTLGSCTVLETVGDGALPVLYGVLESGISGIDSKKEYVVWQVPIVAEDGGISHKRETTCSIEVILKFLKNKGYAVNISNDAGFFVCNYVYYHSLRFPEQKGLKSLFVHVPDFSSINEETQM